jgi:hypothetical protein
MKKILVIALVLSLMCGVSMAGVPKVFVNTFTMTNTFFKPAGLEKKVGGGYLVSSNANGPGFCNLDFNTFAKFQLSNDQYVTVDTGAETTVSGATAYGITTGVIQKTPTENGYRTKEFGIHFATLVPESSIISTLASGFLSKDVGSASVNSKVTIGGKTYDVGTQATLSGDQVKQKDKDIDSNVPQGFGQETGYYLTNKIDEFDMSYKCTLTSGTEKTCT